MKTGWVATTQAPATVTIRAHHTDNPSHKNKLIFFDFSEIISRLILQLRHSLAREIQRNLSVELQFIIQYIKFFTITLHCIRSLKRSSARYLFNEEIHWSDKNLVGVFFPVIIYPPSKIKKTTFICKKSFLNIWFFSIFNCL